MGFRLPLDSIPWVNPSEVHQIVEQDPMAPDNQNELTDSFRIGCDGGRTRWHPLLVRRSVLEPNHVP